MSRLLPVLLIGCLGAVAAGAQEARETADLLVVNKIKSRENLQGNLAFIHFASGKVLARVPVGREPHEVAASADGKYALVSNTGNNDHPGNTLSLIDIAARKELRRVDLGPLWMPHGLVYRDDRFYFTAEGSRVIGAYDPMADHLVWIMGTGQEETHMLLFSRDGTTMFTTNRGSNTVTVLELTADAQTPIGQGRQTVIPTCQGPEGMDLSPDGAELWVGCRYSNEMAIVRVAEKKLAMTFPTHTKALVRVKFTADGKRVLATDLRAGELTVWDVARREEIKRLKMGTGCEGILMLPDGTRALIGVTTDDTVAEIDLQTLAITRRIKPGEGPDGMAWIGPK
jgi:DNA-binding beta-propeller fold protein YncE